jgi:2-(1,2-epoxy-1,2-dihydrophenyl)acetyl-CoA isomerase
MTAARIEAEQAADRGLVFRVVDDGQVLPEAESLAGRLAAGPTAAFASIKRAITAAESLDFDAYLEAEAGLQGEAGRTEDYREGVLAFLEKRASRFRGR